MEVILFFLELHPLAVAVVERTQLMVQVQMAVQVAVAVHLVLLVTEQAVQEILQVHLHLRVQTVGIEALFLRLTLRAVVEVLVLLVVLGR
jgi:hypothetical protein